MNLGLFPKPPRVGYTFKNFMVFKMKLLQMFFITLFAMLFGSSAFAVGPDFTTLTGSVDFSTVGPAILAIAALLAVPLVIRKGAKMVLSAIR